jgi:hypothetical protein
MLMAVRDVRILRRASPMARKKKRNKRGIGFMGFDDGGGCAT